LDLTGDRDEEEDDAAAPLRSLADLRPNEQRERGEAEKEVASPQLSTPGAGIPATLAARRPAGAVTVPWAR
jgi:hypothetical protein